MARVQIIFPERNIFSTEINIRITDLNYGGHLGNDAMLSLLHEARVRFLKHFGYSEMDVEGVGIIMSDVAIQFKTEAFYGENLKIEIATAEFTRVSFDLIYRVSCSGRVVSLAKTGIVFYDYHNKKVVSMPEKFNKKLNV